MGSRLIVSIFNNSKEFGSMKVKAIQLALEEKNATGGIQGRNIRFGWG